VVVSVISAFVALFVLSSFIILFELRIFPLVIELGFAVSDHKPTPDWKGGVMYLIAGLSTGFLELSIFRLYCVTIVLPMWMRFQ
jgi:hypothetical protein